MASDCTANWSTSLSCAYRASVHSTPLRARRPASSSSSGSDTRSLADAVGACEMMLHSARTQAICARPLGDAWSTTQVKAMPLRTARPNPSNTTARHCIWLAGWYLSIPNQLRLRQSATGCACPCQKLAGCMHPWRRCASFAPIEASGEQSSRNFSCGLVRLGMAPYGPPLPSTSVVAESISSTAHIAHYLPAQRQIQALIVL